jgi:hypothetical protein
MSQELKLADTVWHRVVQIVQESLLTGVDCSDLLRQVRLVPEEGSSDTMTLSLGYMQQVKAQHQRLLDQARELSASQQAKRFIIPDEPS